jgi:hypothetical protein
LDIEDHVHIGPDWNVLLDRTRGRHVVVPLRNPSDVWRSWCRRNAPDKFPYSQFFIAWGCLHALDQLRDLDVVCIDKQEDQRVSDWSEVGGEDSGVANWKLLKVDLRPLFELPIVKRHY